MNGLKATGVGELETSKKSKHNSSRLPRDGMLVVEAVDHLKTKTKLVDLP